MVFTLKKNKKIKNEKKGGLNWNGLVDAVLLNTG